LKECFLKFPEGRHEGLRDKPSAINTEIALSVRYSFDKNPPLLGNYYSLYFHFKKAGLEMVMRARRMVNSGKYSVDSKNANLNVL
jgi:hypothetical protein